MKKIFLSIFIFIMLSYGVTAGPISLLDSFSARSFGLAQADVAYKGDLDSILVNPAGLIYLRDISVGAFYLPWFEDMQFFSIAASYPIFSGEEFYGTLGLNVSTFSVDPFVNYDAQGTKLANDVEVGDMLINLAYGFPLIDNLDIGFNVKYLDSKIGYKEVSGDFDFDFGIMLSSEMDVIFGKNKNRNFILGFALQNINSSPPKTRVGISYLFLNQNIMDSTLLLELNSTEDQNIKLSSGIEIGIMQLFKIRAGYKLSADSAIGFTAGGGINYNISGYGLALDYSMIPLQDFGVQHAISFKVIIGESEGEKKIKKGINTMKKYYNNHQYGKTVREAKEVLALDPSNSEALEYQQLVYKKYLGIAKKAMKERKFSESLKYFQAYQKLNPDDKSIASELSILDKIVNDNEKPVISLNDFQDTDTITVNKKDYTITGKITDNVEVKSVKINNIDTDVNNHKVVYKTKEGKNKTIELNVYHKTDKKIYFTLIKEGEIKKYSLPRTRITKLTELKRGSVELNHAVELEEGENTFEILAEDVKGNNIEKEIKIIFELKTETPEPETEEPKK